MEDKEKFVTWDVHREFAERMRVENERRDDENARQNKRIDALETSVTQLGNLTVSVEKMATNMEYMAKEQAKQGTRLEEQDKKLDELKQEPGKKWNTLIYGIISAIAAALGAAIMAGVLH